VRYLALDISQAWCQLGLPKLSPQGVAFDNIGWQETLDANFDR
jgi:hypothetical protein